MVKYAVTAALIGRAVAFPWVAETVGMSRRDFANQRLESRADLQTCGFNPDHVPAQGITVKYPYCGAKFPTPGFQICANNLVPAKVCLTSERTCHERADQEPGRHSTRLPAAKEHGHPRSMPR